MIVIVCSCRVYFIWFYCLRFNLFILLWVWVCGDFGCLCCVLNLRVLLAPFKGLVYVFGFGLPWRGLVGMYWLCIGIGFLAL